MNANCTFEIELELYADYNQVLICDDDLNGMRCPDWTSEEYDRHMAVTFRTITIGTARKALVPVHVELYDGEPTLVTEPWDMVVEGSLAVPSGRLVIKGLMDDWMTSRRVEVTPGPWRMRASRSVDDAGSDGNDRYLLQLWKAPIAPVEVKFDITGRCGPTTEPPPPDDPFTQIDFSDTMKRILADQERSG